MSQGNGQHDPAVVIVTGTSYPNRMSKIKLSIITIGGADGFGAAIVDRFRSEGCRVVILDLNKERCLEKSNGSTAVHAIAGDVSSSELWEEAVSHCMATWGRIDVVVNNAGRVVSQDWALAHTLQVSPTIHQ